MPDLPPTLTSAIAQLAEQIRKYRDKAIGEQNTKASLIEPLLECLGWNIRDLDFVHREYRTKSRDKPVDYALKLLRQPRLFIEAKGLGEDLSERRWVTQVLGYATVAGVEWCVLTDGNEYRIYNAAVALDAEEKLFRKVCIADEDSAIVSSTLHLISRSNLEENLLDAHWKAHFVDRRVKAAIGEMIESAHPGLIRLIRKHVPSLTAKAISGSLARLDVKIEPPVIPIPQPHRVPARPARPRAPRSVGGRKGTRRDVGVALSELIAAGALKAPLALFRRYKGRQMEAMLLPDGKVQFAGATYDTCSTAAENARGTVTGRRMNTNGWTFWQYDDDGVKRELAYARARFVRER